MRLDGFSAPKSALVVVAEDFLEAASTFAVIIDLTDHRVEGSDVPVTDTAVLLNEAAVVAFLGQPAGSPAAFRTVGQRR